jgi:hypothetical protein
MLKLPNSLRIHPFMSRLMSEIQQGASLRKVSAAEKRDFSASLAESDPMFEEKQRNHYQSAVLDANLETYYDILQPSGLTFHTDFMPLSKADAEFFVKHFEARETAISEAMISRGDTQRIPIDECSYLSDSFKSRIAHLEQLLQPYIERMRLRNGADGVFVKFSSRSPKDAVVLQRDRIIQLFHSALAAEAAAAPGGILVKDSVEDKNSRIIAMLVAGTRSLMVTDAASAIHLLRTSERIYQDCLLALDQAERGRFTLNLCVREWSELHPSSEWRCFCRCIFFCCLLNLFNFCSGLRMVKSRRYRSTVTLPIFLQSPSFQQRQSSPASPREPLPVLSLEPLIVCHMLVILLSDITTNKFDQLSWGAALQLQGFAATSACAGSTSATPNIRPSSKVGSWS